MGGRSPSISFEHQRFQNAKHKHGHSERDNAQGTKHCSLRCLLDLVLAYAHWDMPMQTRAITYTYIHTNSHTRTYTHIHTTKHKKRAYVNTRPPSNRLYSSLKAQASFVQPGVPCFGSVNVRNGTHSCPHPCLAHCCCWDMAICN